MSGLESTLLSIHLMLAGISGVHELALEPKEAAQLASAMKRVAEQYSVNISPKTAAWLNLAMIAGGLYGTRAIVIWRKPSKKKEPVNAPPEIKVQPINGGIRPPVTSTQTNPSSIFGFQNNELEPIG